MQGVAWIPQEEPAASYVDLSTIRGLHSAEGMKCIRATTVTRFLASRCRIVLIVSCDTPYSAATSRRLSCRARWAISGQKVGSTCGQCCAGRGSMTGLSTGK